MNALTWTLTRQVSPENFRVYTPGRASPIALDNQSNWSFDPFSQRGTCAASLTEGMRALVAAPSGQHLFLHVLSYHLPEAAPCSMRREPELFSKAGPVGAGPRAARA